jgi:hypothetical protein
MNLKKFTLVTLLSLMLMGLLVACQQAATPEAKPVEEEAAAPAKTEEAMQEEQVEASTGEAQTVFFLLPNSTTIR